MNTTDMFELLILCCVLVVKLECSSCIIIEEDILPVTFKNVRLNLISQSTKTKNTLYIRSAENLRDYIIGNRTDTVRINDQIIPTLYGNSITNIRNIAIFDLSRNQIQGIEEGAFGNLGLVQALNLSSNLIRVIRSNVFTNIDVKFLFLGHNRIFKIEAQAFTDSRKLYMIDLSYNRIRTWNWRWFRGTFPKSINMKHNFLEILPEDSFKFIDDLDIPDDQRILHHLLFDHNEIHIIHRFCLPRLKKIIFFDLSYNFLETVLKGTFDSVDSINKLDLSHNRIFYLENTLFKNTRIGYVNLKNNYLVFINIQWAPVLNLDFNPLDSESEKQWIQWKRSKGHLLTSPEYDS
ncbi:hypothetical protein WA026_002341 [Henosepilachna vigintioctopunctata]|uniref:Uncharacterized protein n=1 Tax=Henosepilachna vigintioctopunctata TaxID=420089 RepID=A0AAW1TZY7_9CUCU